MPLTHTPNLRVRIHQIDHTVVPAGPLDCTTFPKAPTIRIYGISSTGVKTCVHVHQVYPYFFIEYNGNMKPEDVNRYISRLNHSLDHAISISLKRNPQSSKSKYIRSIVLVKGVHFYGFHSSYSPFLKILLVEPGLVSRAVTLMQSGTVMQTRFRIFEGHLTYILQFMCDFGLYGCGWIDLDQVWKRGTTLYNDDQETKETETPPSEEFASSPSPHVRQSRMELEIDVVAHQILNRHLLTAREIHHTLQIPAPPSTSDGPLVPSVRELWDDERHRRIDRGLPPSPELPIDPSEASREKGGDWVMEAHWWEEIMKKIEKERGKAVHDKLPQKWERWVMTTFESVEALWEERWKTWKPGGHSVTTARETSTSPGDEGEKNPYSDASGTGTETQGGRDIGPPIVEVDTAMLSSQEFGRLLEIEETEWPKVQDELVVDNSKVGLDNEYQVDFEELEQIEEEDEPISDKVKDQEEEAGSPIVDQPQDINENPFLDQENTIDQSQSDLRPTKRKFDKCGPNPSTYEGRSSTDRHDVHDDDKSIPPPSRPVKRPKIAWPDHLVDNGVVTSILPQSRFTFATFVPTMRRPTRSTRPPRILVYSITPPTTSELLGSIENYGAQCKIYRAPYYSKELDAPKRPREYAGLLYHLKSSDGLNNLEEWEASDGHGSISVQYSKAPKLLAENIFGWEYASTPPSVKLAKQWLASPEGRCPSKHSSGQARSQIRGLTQSSYKLHRATNKPKQTSNRARQNLATFSCEVFAPSRPNRLPNPENDGIVAIFYAWQDMDYPASNDGFICNSGVLALEGSALSNRRLRNIPTEVASNELELLNRLADIVNDVDPDILTGWNVQLSSWGYVAARCNTYGLDLAEVISRAPGSPTMVGTDQWGLRKTSTVKITGRHVLNLWRIMRSEQSLNVHTYENSVFHLLHRRVPLFSPDTLTKWYHSPSPFHASQILEYFIDRAITDLEILEEAEIVTKTAEFARVFGVDFFSVISRGSQFKVESFMFRIAKPENFVLISPSRADVGKQNAAECMPLIMEPLSAFYTSPLVVLDFQSLYPSVMIAYNYCYSTCLGRAVDFKGENKLGISSLDLEPELLEKLKDHIAVAPNGILYVKPEVRHGLLGRMLTELLQTRVMVKQAMKGIRNDRALRRILDARQLSLKFICNVTYGYTSATYSGRMPAVEIADSIVQTGRETLEKAIRAIDSTKKWGAQVVYGDTDSIFIYLKGKTKEQAFRIGHDIADTITTMNPAPIKLKFEKVYHPCVLVAKKRYVGFKFESPDDTEPIFDAKGIETVRRDGIPAQAKMTEACLRILFKTQDLSLVKEYCTSSWLKILDNRASVQDFIFAKEVRMGTYSETGPPPPGVAVAARRMLRDANDEPQYGERVPYIIIRGDPGSRLVDRALTPSEFFEKKHHKLDANYYISQVLIPPLERVFNLVGADVRAWYEEMPKALRTDQTGSILLSPRKKRILQFSGAVTSHERHKIDEHFITSECLSCGDFAVNGICDDCRNRPAPALSNLQRRLHDTEGRLMQVQRVCASCCKTNISDVIECDSIDCVWFFERKEVHNKLEFMGPIWEWIGELDVGMDNSKTKKESITP